HRLVPRDERPRDRRRQVLAPPALHREQSGRRAAWPEGILRRPAGEGGGRRSKTAPAARPAAPSRRPVEHDLLLAALPHPIVVLAEGNPLVYTTSTRDTL